MLHWTWGARGSVRGAGEEAAKGSDSEVDGGGASGRYSHPSKRRIMLHTTGRAAVHPETAGPPIGRMFSHILSPHRATNVGAINTSFQYFCMKLAVTLNWVTRSQPQGRKRVSLAAAVCCPDPPACVRVINLQLRCALTQRVHRERE